MLRKFILYWLPVLVWAGVIYYSSSQPYQDQDLRPTLANFLDLELVKVYLNDFKFHYAGEEISVEEKGAAGFIEFLIRKGAHFGVYFILGFLLFRAIHQHTASPRKAFLLALIGTIFYAASDEFHQGFTANRTPKIEDVVLDSIGAYSGVLTIFWVKKKKHFNTLK
jgi:VanZ family protein